MPDALVGVRITKITNIPASMLQGTQWVYAIGQISSRLLGRSRLISAAGDFDLTAEAEPWELEVPVASGATIPLRVEIWHDQGDVAPNRLERITTSVGAPWSSGTRTAGSSVQFEYELTKRAVPPRQARVIVPPNPTGAQAQATVRARPALVLEFTNIQGLYQPGFRPTGVANPRRSEPRPGYRSEDDQGRVFLNRDLSGAYQRDTQFIELTVSITAQRGALPPNTKVRWTIRDPDDQFDNATSVHREAAAYIDNNDYLGGTLAGAHGGDNEGTPDHSPRWEEVGGHSLTVNSDTEADTAVTSNQSQVRIHAPNVAGDSFIVRATLEPNANLDVFEAETGIMTMFHRIDVEYRKMHGALDIPVQNIPPLFVQARAELNIVEEAELADQDPIGADATLTADCRTYLNANFTHASDAGWFLLLSAMMPYSLPPGASGGVLFERNVALQRTGTGAGTYEYFDVLGSFANADYMRLSGGGNSVGFGVRSAVPFMDSGVQKTRIRIQPHDIQPDFTAGNGSLSHAYNHRLWFFPRGRLESGTWTVPGYGLPNTVRARVYEPGATYTSGISPSEVVGGATYFAGRTVVFTGVYRDSTTGLPEPDFATKIVRTLAHEFVHAFGMPHKCGFFDYQTPRDRTCHLNYWNVWMLNTARQPTPNTNNRMGDNMCGRHLKEVRRVHLEDNLGLRSLGW